MSYSTLPAPTDIFGVNSVLRSQRTFPTNGEQRGDESHSPMSEPRSPLFRPSMTAEMPHLASLYNSPYAAAAVAAAVAGQGARAVGAPSTFGPYARPPAAPGFYPGLINADGWRRSQYLSQLDFCWPHGFRSLDTVVGPRTKAPREATSILKSWLNEHKDNPYPTKSEKMTLSIVTHMTLTQVSTWFANARRRIKKENKMTWTPKTRCGERDGSSSNDDESEKDYFGRTRSPLSAVRDSGKEEMRRSSGEYEDVKSGHSHFGEAPTSSSRRFAPTMTHKGSSHPLFAAFPGLQPPYFNPAIQDALRQQMLSTQNARLARCSDEGLARSSASTYYASEKKGDRASPTQLLKKVCHGDEITSKSPPHIQYDRATKETRLPFVRLRRNSSENENPEETPSEKNTPDDDVMPMSARVISKSDTDEEKRPFPMSSHSDKSERNASIEGTYRYNGMKEENNLEPAKSDNEPESDHAVPSLCQPFYISSGAMTKPSGKMDALSCWIREFQQLVSSGQELKAKQALATALAVAAKAGAYSGIGSNRTAYHHQPLHPNSPDESLGSGMQHRDRRSPVSPKRNHRFSPIARADAAFSSDSSNRQSLSPHTPPGNGERRPSSVQETDATLDDAPINLTKPSGAWKRGNLTADDTCIEA